MNFEITDELGYSKRKDEIDEAILTSLSSGPKPYAELYALLYRAHIGDAKSENRYDLSYSTTGAICRAALNSLRWRKKIYDTWDTENKKESPFLFYKAAV